MKKIYFGILCCLLGFTTSCSDDDNATALLQIDPSTDLVFEAVGGTRTIEVKTDQATWQVESNQTWCKVEKSDGTHFTVTAEENTASEPMPQAAGTGGGGAAPHPRQGRRGGRYGPGGIEGRSERDGYPPPGRNYI